MRSDTLTKATVRTESGSRLFTENVDFDVVVKVRLTKPEGFTTQDIWKFIREDIKKSLVYRQLGGSQVVARWSDARGQVVIGNVPYEDEQ
jgi:hypothetical protein